MTDDIAPLRPPHEMPPVRSLDDLERHWRSIKGPWGFDEPQLFCQLFDSDGSVLPQIVNITDCPPEPEDEMLVGLFRIMDDVLVETSPEGSVAVMFARPGGSGLRAADRAWARRLTFAGTAATVRVWPVCLGTDAGVQVAAPDDLAA